MGLLDDIKQDEGLRLLPYKDTVGKLTIGYGLNLDAGISEIEANWLLQNRVSDIKRNLYSSFNWYRFLNDARKDVIVNMVYNLGLAGVLRFKKLIGSLEAQDYDRAAHEMLDSKWASQVGKRAERLAQTMMKGADND
jgi:lysozyme